MWGENLKRKIKIILGKGKSRSKYWTRQTYWICGKERHLRKQFPQRKNQLLSKNQKNKNASYGDFANLCQVYENADVLTVSSEEHGDEWILDLGCISHKSPRKEWFFDYEATPSGKVLTGITWVVTLFGLVLSYLEIWWIT